MLPTIVRRGLPFLMLFASLLWFSRNAQGSFPKGVFPFTAKRLTNVTRSGTFTVAGTTVGPATSVTVNSQPAARYGDRAFAREGFTPVDDINIFTAIAQNAAGQSDTRNSIVLLPSVANPVYDANGNLRSQGNIYFTWRTYDYDDENQLVRVTSTYDTKSEFAYDGFGRRRVAREYRWQSSAWVLTSEMRYVYDGMLAIQERDANNNALVSYTRGLDLSGSLQGAGGIGGLLARTDHTWPVPALAISYYQADGAGNVTALVNTNEVLVARYAYDPYGNVLGQDGPLADANRYRFSSKEIHKASGLYYYTFRFYDPSLQRWLNADPLGEAGGINLHQFVYNTPPNLVDRDGRIVPLLIAAAIIYFAGEAIVNAPSQDDVANGNTFGPYDDMPDPGFVAGTILAPGVVIPLAIANEMFPPDPNLLGGTPPILPGSKIGGSKPCPPKSPPKPAAKTAPLPRLPGATVDPLTGQPVGRFIGSQSGPPMIEPLGGRTVAAGRGGVDTHTLYPNGANYQRLNPVGHPTNPTPHAHGHAPGTGPYMRGQGPSLDTSGNIVPWDSPGAHWPFP